VVRTERVAKGNRSDNQTFDCSSTSMEPAERQRTERG
jgi:hypothetical protein